LSQQGDWGPATVASSTSQSLLVVLHGGTATSTSRLLNLNINPMQDKDQWPA